MNNQTGGRFIATIVVKRLQHWLVFLLFVTLPVQASATGRLYLGNSAEPVAELTSIRVVIDGHLVLTHLAQTFANPLGQAADGVYELELPPGAVLLEASTGGTNANSASIVVDRDQAENVYRSSVGAGLPGHLHDLPGPGFIRIALARLAAGERRRIDVTYMQPIEVQASRLRHRLRIGADSGDLVTKALLLELEIVDGSGKRLPSGSHDRTMSHDRFDGSSRKHDHRWG